MFNIAQAMVELSRLAVDEAHLIEMGTYCWLDPVLIVDLTREEEDKE